jgi:hypothetical protein
LQGTHYSKYKGSSYFSDKINTQINEIRIKALCITIFIRIGSDRNERGGKSLVSMSAASVKHYKIHRGNRQVKSKYKN